MKLAESETLELKKSTSELKEAVISICAILNKHGKGRIYFGVKNDGTVSGQQASDTTLRSISQTIADHIEPKIYPKIIVKKILSKPCVLVEFEGHDSPYFAYGRSYIRVADSDRQLAVKELEKFLMRKNNYHSHWESESTDASLKQISVKAVRLFVKRANDAGRMVLRYDNAKNVLNKLGLIKGKRLLNAGRVLFSSDHSLEVQTAVFAGTDKITFLDIQSFRDDLFDLVDKSETYIKEHINWRADLSGSRRVEIPEIPLRALREAIINSLCHRDFTNPKGNEIAIFKDRIEIYNPGTFPDDHSPSDFISGSERSILRNPLIANAFYLTSDIERWGSGLKRIHDICHEANLKVDFKNLKTGFLVTFWRPDVQPAVTTKVVSKSGQKGGRKKWSELSPKRKAILELIKKDPTISRQELAAKLGINPSAVQKHLQKLKTEGLLKRMGPDKGGYWQIVN